MNNVCTDEELRQGFEEAGNLLQTDEGMAALHEIANMVANPPKLVTEGFMLKTSSRELDLDKNPITDWEYRYASCYGSGINPYVYTTSAKAKQGFNGVLGESNLQPKINFSHPNKPNYDGDYMEYQDAYKEWKKNATIGYRETISTVVPARIMEMPNG
jgi:hypothetical protein